MRPNPRLTVGRCAAARTVIQVVDVQSDPEVSDLSRAPGESRDGDPRWPCRWYETAIWSG
jgi:hypothetical protein